MSNYSPDWNLKSIPDELLGAECGRRSALKRKALKGGRPLKRTKDSELAEKRRKKRESVAKWRAKQKGGK